MNFRPPKDNPAMKRIMKHLMTEHHFSFIEAKLVYYCAYEYLIMMQDFGHVFPERALGMLGLGISSWDDFLNAHPEAKNCPKKLRLMMSPLLADHDFFHKKERIGKRLKKQPDSKDLTAILNLLIEEDHYTYEQAKMLYFCAYHYDCILEDTGRFYPIWAMVMLGLERSEKLNDDIVFLDAGYPGESNVYTPDDLI